MNIVFDIVSISKQLSATKIEKPYTFREACGDINILSVTARGSVTFSVVPNATVANNTLVLLFAST